MKRIIIICEGQTEQEFCKNVLAPYFSSFEIYLEAPTIKKTQGGIVRWAVLKNQIERHLLEDKTAYLTTLIDYYGLYPHHEFPNWDEAERTSDRSKRMDILEKGMANDIRENLRYRFLPYIQLHEFEGLLFCDISVFETNFEAKEIIDFEYLAATIQEFTNPELINDGNETAPSKRLERHIKGYNKKLYGATLALETGLNTIRKKCPRFNNWILQIEKICYPNS